MYLEEKGYIFKIGVIKARFGNILTCLENILLVARNTKSLAVIKNICHHYDVLGSLKSFKYDFRSDENENCDKVMLHDNTFITKHPYDKKLFEDPDQWCLNYVYDLIKRDYPKTDISVNTLVINIRGGGDIFKKENPHPEYFQPPLSFYQDIIRRHSYDDILIVTDSVKYNPVIKALRAWKSNIRVSDNDLSSQVNLILNARHLVMARSTFSLFLGRLAKNLKAIYVWCDFDWKWGEWQPTKDNCLSKDVRIMRYHSNSYIQLGEWSASKDQLKLMLNHPEWELKRSLYEAT